MAFLRDGFEAARLTDARGETVGVARVVGGRIAVVAGDSGTGFAAVDVAGR